MKKCILCELECGTLQCVTKRGLDTIIKSSQSRVDGLWVKLKYENLGCYFVHKKCRRSYNRAMNRANCISPSVKKRVTCENELHARGFQLVCRDEATEVCVDMKNFAEKNPNTDNEYKSETVVSPFMVPLGLIDSSVEANHNMSGCIVSSQCGDFVCDVVSDPDVLHRTCTENLACSSLYTDDNCIVAGFDNVYDLTDDILPM